MWLVNTSSIQLHEFADDQVPLYVILSHRWEGEEVTFRDLCGGAGKEKRGYAKILGCCSQAQKDGFEFAWIDSCCIDKSSSAELSEAINSMYRWYQNAQVCYVYLSDVPAIEDLDHYADSSEFRQSKWFTRGWTLQELLAPEIVVFYNHAWAEIGTKSSMDSLISSITNIHPRYLSGSFKLENASAAQKMSWASKRTTTRPEDTAYCLMGLFDVNMPLLYGEGRKAFYRLQLEIIKNSADESIFAWGRTSSDPDFRIPDRYESQLDSLLAESPGKFEDCGDIISEHSFRPPYTMTSKGLQMDVKLISRQADIGLSYVPFSADASLPNWILTLHCRRQSNPSKHIAIFVSGSDDTFGYARISDWLLLSHFPPEGEGREANPWRKIIIDASLKDYATLTSQRSSRLLLDVSDLQNHGYSVLARQKDRHPIKFEEDGTCVNFTTMPAFPILLECERRNEQSLRLVIGRRMKEKWSLSIENEESYDRNEVNFLAGEFTKLIVKRRAILGESVLVLILMIKKARQICG